MPNHSVELKSYRYSLRPGDMPTTRAWLTLYGDSGVIAHALFLDQSISKGAKLTSNGTVFLYFRDSEFPRVIDILRKEAPVYLHYTTSGDDVTWAQLGTGTEPVGEEESEP